MGSLRTCDGRLKIDRMNVVNTDTVPVFGIKKLTTDSSTKEATDNKMGEKIRYGGFCGKFRTRSYSMDSLPVSGQSLVKENGYKHRPCSKIVLWMFACFALSLLSLMVIFVVWTLVSYHSAITSLEDRLMRLEDSEQDYRLWLDRFVNERVEVIVAQVRHIWNNVSLFIRQQR